MTEYNITKISKRNEYGEWEVYLYKGGKKIEAATYFTDDYEDAVGTARHMVKHKHKESK